MNSKQALIIVIAVIACGLDAVSPAAAQNYPARPISLIVPFAAGGPADVLARIVKEPMSRTMGQPIIIENVVGAGGTTGSTRTMRAIPNGYTIQIGHVGTHTAAVALYPNLAYRPDSDFEPIGIVAETAISSRGPGEDGDRPLDSDHQGSKFQRGMNV